MIAAALLCAALGAGPPTPFFWPKPEVVEELDVPDVIRADGVPVRLHLIRSKKSVEQLLPLYARAFTEAGFYVQKTQVRRLAEPHLTGLDARALISYSAILTPHDDGTTTVLMGEASLGRKKASAGGDVAPLYRGAREVMRTEQEGVRVMSYLAPDATVDQVRAFYRKTLVASGFTASDDDPGRFEKRDVQLSLMLQPAEAKSVSVVLVELKSAPLAR